MQQWEYLVITVPSKQGGATVLSQATGKKYKINIWSPASETLNALAEDGWEVVAMQCISDTLFTLRRPK